MVTRSNHNSTGISTDQPPNQLFDQQQPVMTEQAKELVDTFGSSRLHNQMPRVKPMDSQLQNIRVNDLTLQSIANNSRNSGIGFRIWRRSIDYRELPVLMK